MALKRHFNDKEIVWTRLSQGDIMHVLVEEWTSKSVHNVLTSANDLETWMSELTMKCMTPIFKDIN